MFTRAPSSPTSMRLSALPSSPSRFSRGTFTLSKLSSAVPVLRSTMVSTRRASKGETSRSTRKVDSCPWQSGLKVRATTMPKSAKAPLVIHSLRPLST